MIFALPFGHMLVFGAIPAFWLAFLAVTFTAGVYGMTIFFRRRSASVMTPKYEIAAALLARGTAKDELKAMQAEVRASAGEGNGADQSLGRRDRRVHPQDNVAVLEHASLQYTQGAEEGRTREQHTRQLFPHNEGEGAAGLQHDRDTVDDVLGSIESIVGDEPRAR
jgi:hypothetical protein